MLWLPQEVHISSQQAGDFAMELHPFQITVSIMLTAG